MHKMFFKQKISEEVWFNTYKWETDKNIFDTFRRVAKEVASKEKDTEYWEEAYFQLLCWNYYVPGGRILANAGTGLKGTGLINCFVSGFEGESQDSIEGIYRELTRQAKILKSEGGYGFCVNALRPKGAYISGIGSETPGAVTFLDLWDKSSQVITSGTEKKKNKKKGKNKIRKGAQMVTMSCWHPSVEEFIHAKQQPGKLTKFNMSVLLHDDFMEAVKNNKPWNLEFPETDHPKYDLEWDGDLYGWKSKGYPVKRYKTYADANELYEMIMTATYNRNEPGVLFPDRANLLNNLWWIEKLYATNPCGEQWLPKDASCDLGAINLVEFINKDKTDFDYEKIEKHVDVIVRFQDAIYDVTYFPLEEQYEEAKSKRRVGIGYMGYGSALCLMKIAYGSKKALKITEKLCAFVTNKLYQASAKLAKEKGSFPLYDEEKYLQSKFVQQALWPETIEMIKEFGIRNSHLTTCAPTGNTGVFAGVVSGGFEPRISNKYIRTVIVPYAPDWLDLPKNIDWDLETFESDEEWDWFWIKEGDESLLKTYLPEDIGNSDSPMRVYKYDRNRGLTKEEVVYDYATLEMGDEFWSDKEKMGVKFYGNTIEELTVDDHLKTMEIFAKYIDSSLSKTINLPNDYPYEDFKNVYKKAYDSGTIKGVTTYRWGTMTNVVGTENSQGKRPKKIVLNHAPKRDKTLPCDIHTTQIKGEKWTVVVGKENDTGHPFEIFAGKQTIKFPENGKITKKGSGKYILETEGNEPFDLVKNFGEHGSYGYSKLLQHGTPLFAIVDLCDKMLENVLGFNKAMGRIIKKYIKKEELKYMKCSSCRSTNIVFQEGCISCLDCGHSKCS